jgi:predicted AlkP superfamily phosphohydrolase/phosphomutase
MKLRKTLWALPLLGLGLAAACGTPDPPEKYSQKMVIIGFDGMDPRLTGQWMAEGRLPNMAKLAREGSFEPLGTTPSPESPTSWSSFAIGGNPGRHDVFDFLVRNTTTYMPDLGMVKRIAPRFLFDYIPISMPKAVSMRGGTSFWVIAGRAGVRSRVLTVPVTFPAEDVPNGKMLSGLPLPDVRGTIGTFYYFATDLSRYEEGNTEMGGILKRLVFDGDTATTELVGPQNPIVKAEEESIRARGPKLSDADQAKLAELTASEDVRLPFKIHWNRQAKSARIEIDGSTVDLKQGEWSNWVPLQFRVNLLVRVNGMAQLYLIRADQDLQLYISPVNFRPDSPPLPISAPPSFAKNLQRALGTFRTLGWAEATWPLNEDRISEKAFMDDLFRAFDDRERIILHEIDQRKWDLLVGVIESTDRVQHMFWRLIDPEHPMYNAAEAAKYGNSILRVYERCDEMVGKVLEHVPKGTTVVVLSDHGFHSFREAVNLNTWLVQEGFIARKGQAADKNLNDLFSGGGQFWENVDWTRTKAYSLGLGQIYFNMAGREGQGIVHEGEEYRELQDEISKKLLDLRDPKTGGRVVSAVYKRDDVFWGPYIENAPDLQVGFADGYRVSWQTSLGGSPAGILYPNMRKWSGDHCSFDYKTEPGTIISNHRLATGNITIMDLGPTVLKYFGIAVPDTMDGKPLF